MIDRVDRFSSRINIWVRAIHILRHPLMPQYDGNGIDDGAVQEQGAKVHDKREQACSVGIRPYSGVSATVGQGPVFLSKMQVDCKLLTGNVHSIPAEQDETISIVRQRLAQRVGGTVSFKLMHQVLAASRKGKFDQQDIHENFIKRCTLVAGPNFAG